jgi:hypothetical protein
VSRQTAPVRAARSRLGRQPFLRKLLGTLAGRKTDADAAAGNFVRVESWRLPRRGAACDAAAVESACGRSASCGGA